MPPVKFKDSQVLVDRNTKKKTVQHFYMKSTPLKDLQEALEKSNTPPKQKQKIRNELVRRNI